MIPLLAVVVGGLFGVLLHRLSEVLPAGDESSQGSALLTAGVTGLLFGAIVVRYGQTPNALLVAVLVGFLLLVALIDLRCQLVPNTLTYPAFGLGVVGAILSGGPVLLTAVIGAVLAFSVFALTALLRPGDLGGGDIKLAALLGLLFGFPGVLWPLLLGGVGGVIGAATGRHHGLKHVPYAPFLSAGAIIALLASPVPLSGLAALF